MALSGEQLIAETAELREAVRQLIKFANKFSIGDQVFTKEALPAGLAALDDVSRWGAPKGIEGKFREDAKRRYEELFKDL